MHDNQILHRDIKPANILFLEQGQDQNHVCFADLGLACNFDNAVELNKQCGSLGYVAPEILHGKPFTSKADVFSLGVVFYNLVSG